MRIQIAVALVLFGGIAVCDVARRRIPNLLNVAVFALGAAASFGDGGLRGLLSSAGAAALLLAALFPLWRMRALGGGDLKAAVACAAWVRLGGVAEFALGAALACGCVAVMCWGVSAPRARREVLTNLRLATMRAMPHAPIEQVGGRVSVPCGAAIALAAAIVVLGG